MLWGHFLTERTSTINVVNSQLSAIFTTVNRHILEAPMLFNENRADSEEFESEKA